MFLGAAAPVIANGFGRTKAHKTSLLDTAMDSSTVIFVAALLLRDAVRSRRRWLRHAEAEREQEAERRVAEERLRIGSCTTCWHTRSA